MNITNNPNYYCQTSKKNPYLDTLTFKRASTPLAKQMQITFLLDRISNVTNTVPYIVTNGNGKPTAFYSFIMNEVAVNPKKYGCTKRELESAYLTTFNVLNSIGLSYKNTKTINKLVFDYGVTILNDKYFEDASNGRINPIYFVDGMKKMGDDLYKFKAGDGFQRQ